MHRHIFSLNLIRFYGCHVLLWSVACGCAHSLVVVDRTEVGERLDQVILCTYTSSVASVAGSFCCGAVDPEFRYLEIGLNGSKL